MVQGKENVLKEVFLFESSLVPRQRVMIYGNIDENCIQGNEQVERLIEHFGFQKNYETLSEGNLYINEDIKLYMGVIRKENTLSSSYIFWLEFSSLKTATQMTLESYSQIFQGVIDTLGLPLSQQNIKEYLVSNHAVIFPLGFKQELIQDISLSTIARQLVSLRHHISHPEANA